jgi:hypothetical protein
MAQFPLLCHSHHQNCNSFFSDPFSGVLSTGMLRAFSSLSMLNRMFPVLKSGVAVIFASNEAWSDALLESKEVLSDGTVIGVGCIKLQSDNTIFLMVPGHQW